MYASLKKCYQKIKNANIFLIIFVNVTQTPPDQFYNKYILQ